MHVVCDTYLLPQFLLKQHGYLLCFVSKSPLGITFLGSLMTSLPLLPPPTQFSASAFSETSGLHAAGPAAGPGSSNAYIIWPRICIPNSWKRIQIGPALSGVHHNLVSCGENMAGLMGYFEFHKAHPFKDWVGQILY